MLFDGISKETRRLEQAYVKTLKLGQKIGLDPELQVKLDQFRQHLGRNAATARLTDLDRKYGKGSAIDEEFARNPEISRALSSDTSGELKTTLKSFGDVVRALPEALRGVVATALLHALSEVYKLTHGEDMLRPQQARAHAPAQSQATPEPVPQVAEEARRGSTVGLEQKVMEVLRNSPDVDIPKQAGTVKEWADYLVTEREQVQQGTFLRGRGMEPVPDGGFIVVDVPKHAPARVFNFRSEPELVAAADATGLKWRAQGWHPVTAIGQSLLDLGNRERVGLYRSMNEAVTDTLQPENSRDRAVVMSQLKHLSGETVHRATKAEEIPKGQREDLIAAMRSLERMDDGLARIDGVGFRSQHLAIGKELASKADLTQAEASVARDLAVFYSKQLKEEDAELADRAVAGRDPNLGELDAESLRSRMKRGEEPANEKVQAQSVEVAVPGRGVPQRERAEAIETVGVGQGRRFGVALG